MPPYFLVPNPTLLRITELAEAERLVLRAARNLEDPLSCPGFVALEFHAACNGGPDGWAAFEALHGLLQLLAARGRRPLRLNPVDAPMASPQERCLLALVGACQAENPAHVEALLRWLLPPVARAAAADHARRLAAALKRSGLFLHPRRMARPRGAGASPPLALPN